jgi:hypothetical protein
MQRFCQASASPDQKEVRDFFYHGVREEGQFALMVHNATGCERDNLF